MKKLGIYMSVFLFSGLLLCGESVAQDKKLSKRKKKEIEILAKKAEVKDLIKTNSFRFVVSSVSMSNIPSDVRANFMNGDYGITLKKDYLNVFLPSFSTSRTGDHYNGSTGPYNFTSKNFFMIRQETVNDGWLYTITSDAKQNSDDVIIKIEVFPDGNAYATIQGNRKDPMGFKGHVRPLSEIMPN